jgi:hypothetical protein
MRQRSCMRRKEALPLPASGRAPRHPLGMTFRFSCQRSVRFPAFRGAFPTPRPAFPAPCPGVPRPRIPFLRGNGPRSPAFHPFSARHPSLRPVDGAFLRGNAVRAMGNSERSRSSTCTFTNQVSFPAGNPSRAPGNAAFPVFLLLLSLGKGVQSPGDEAFRQASRVDVSLGWPYCMHIDTACRVLLGFRVGKAGSLTNDVPRQGRRLPGRLLWSSLAGTKTDRPQ